MASPIHPRDILFRDDKPFPTLPVVDHYAGTQTRLKKALLLQKELGPIFDITGDCEDGAPAGLEVEHAEMVADLIQSPENQFGRFGARIHDFTHPNWRRDLSILVASAGRRLAFITLPKVRKASDVATQISALRELEAKHRIQSPIPVHVLIETHGGLHEVWRIAALPGVESLDFGLMDFVSAHQGAIPASAMKSPEQFEHPLITRAKLEIAAAALAHSIIPTHNVSVEIADLNIVERDATLARARFGYLRMWSIHPNQILPIVRAMQPEAIETAEAAAILIAAQDATWGPIKHDGRLHDRASYRYYWALLERARQTAAPLEADIVDRFFA